MDKYYGQFKKTPGQCVDEFIHKRYFGHKRYHGGFFIECGAFDGVFDSSCKFFEESQNWSGINIEPVPFIYKKLINNRPKSTNLNMALSNTTGVSEFTHAVHPSPKYGKLFGNGSLTHLEPHMKLLIERKCTFEKFEVKTMTYKDLITNRSIKYVDLFVLDVEGHELEVIDGMVGSDVMPYVICVEFPKIGIKALSKKLEPLGYKFDAINHNNAHYVNQKIAFSKLQK